MGRSGFFSDGIPLATNEIKILTESSSLLPEFFIHHLEMNSGLKVVVTQVNDPDRFIELAPQADLLWARNDWIRATDLHLKSLNQSADLGALLNRSISPDFYEPDKYTATLLPLLWTLPVFLIQEPSSFSKVKSFKDLALIPGKINWPFSQLDKYVPGFNLESVKSSDKPLWILEKLSKENMVTPSVWWFPKERHRPFVISLAFVENSRIPQSQIRKLLQVWIEPAPLVRLATENELAITLVSTEEMLPPTRRASALRAIGLEHLSHP